MFELSVPDLYVIFVCIKRKSSGKQVTYRTRYLTPAKVNFTQLTWTGEGDQIRLQGRLGPEGCRGLAPSLLER